MRATGFSHKHHHTITSTISGAHFYTSPVDAVDNAPGERRGVYSSTNGKNI